MNRFLYDNKLLIRIWRHIVFFALTVLLFTQITYFQNGKESYFDILLVTLENAIFFFSYAYITIFILIPVLLLRQRVVSFILLFLLVGIAISALKLVVSDRIFYASISPENISQRGIISLRFIVVNTKDMTFIVALLCIAKYVKDFIYTDQLRKKLEQQNKIAQSKLLQSQFDPHFLFNTINNLYALSLLNPEQTREVIHRIKTVLKYIIDESQKSFVELKDEISLVRNYIQLEKLRYGKRLKINFTTSGEITYFQIPPMILFILVENCFKHGSSLDAGTPWINIEIKTEPGKIVLKTENSKPDTVIKPEATNYSKFGIDNLKKRLLLLYPNNESEITIENTKDIFKVNLVLKEKIEIKSITYR